MKIKKIHNVETNEIIEREMTAEEIDPTLTWSDEQKAKAEAQAEAEAQAQIARQALLDKLGITADEAKLLLG